MAQVTVNNLDTIDRLKNDSAFRKSFLENTEKFMGSNNFRIDAGTLDKAIEKQLEGINKLPAGSAARTAVLITIF
jgi:hypothetical protein